MSLFLFVRIFFTGVLTSPVFYACFVSRVGHSSLSQSSPLFRYLPFLLPAVQPNWQLYLRRTWPVVNGRPLHVDNSSVSSAPSPQPRLHHHLLLQLFKSRPCDSKSRPGHMLLVICLSSLSLLLPGSSARPEK
jgi:hypothetical protein